MVKILRLWCKTQFLRELEGLGMGFCTSKQNWMVTGYDPKATRTSEPTKKPNDWWLNHVTSPNFLAEIINNGWSSSDSININLFFWWIWWWISWWNPNVSKKQPTEICGPSGSNGLQPATLRPLTLPAVAWRMEFQVWEKMEILRDNHGILCLWICMELWYL